jgi:hypothetical protein
MIAFDKEMTAPNGAPVTYHVVKRGEVGPDADALTLFVDSYTSREAFLDGHDPLAHAAPRITFAELVSCSGFMDEVIEAMTGSGLFEGAVPSLSTQATEQEVLEQAGRTVRSRRDRLLSDSDWIVIRAADTGVSVPEPWRQYRQALRDITEQAGFPLDVTWPDPPS